MDEIAIAEMAPEYLQAMRMVVAKRYDGTFLNNTYRFMARKKPIEFGKAYQEAEDRWAEQVSRMKKADGFGQGVADSGLSRGLELVVRAMGGGE